MNERAQGLGEEIANAASHGIGFVLALAALPVLASSGESAARPNTGLVVFIASMLLVYLASALYHGLPDGRAKWIWKRVDHAAIFVFIAGSCTPFALRINDGATTLTVVWALAAVGAALKLLELLNHRVASTGVYVVFGWLALAAIGPASGQIAREALLLILAGGAAYSVGTLFYLLDDRVRYGHAVWHLFVLGGSACHFAAAVQQAT